MIISSIHFLEDGAVVTFQRDEEVDEESRIAMNRELFIGSTEETVDHLADLHDLTVVLVAETLNRLAGAKVADAEDDQPGFDNPNEREVVR